MTKDGITLIRTTADWIERATADQYQLLFPEGSLINSHKPIPEACEVVKALRWYADQEEHPPFICVYRAVCGWQTAFHTWDSDGFYDVQHTGFGPYGHSKKAYNIAVAEGKAWAGDNDVELRLPPYSRQEGD